MSTAVTIPEWLENAYEEHRRYVLKVLSRRCGWLQPDECEEVFQEAYLVLLERERDGRLNLGDMAPTQVRAFLTQTAINKALDEGKRAGRSRSVPLEGTELNVADGVRGPEEVAAAGLEGARVREIVGDLSERKRAIVKLRFFFERSPDEIQHLLGISERVYRRELERAMRQIQDGYSLVREGSYCDSRRSGIIALVSGIAGPGRARAAREHLASCPSCSAWAAEMRDAARKVGALVPMPDLLLGRGPLEQLLGAIEGIRDGAVEAGANAKQHTSVLAARVDQASAGVLSGTRPGAAAAIVAGCIAIGGSTTYCAVHGVPKPLADAAGSIVGQGSKEKEPTLSAPPPSSAPPPAATAPVPEPAAAPAPAPAAAPRRDFQKRAKRHRRKAAAGSSRSARVRGAEPAPEPEPAEESTAPAPDESEPAPEEFGFEGTPAPPAAPSSSPSSGGEFGP